MVCGGGNGIGEETAVAMAADGATAEGATVVVDDLGPQHVTGLPVFLASDEATGVTGCTLAVAGDDVAFVTDPERERTLSTDDPGGWTAAELADRWDVRTEGLETTRLSRDY